MRAALLAGLLVAACARDPADRLELRIERAAEGTRIRLLPASGWRINALLPPAFEQADGSVIRLRSDSVSADSAYYLAPPTATLPGRHGELRGTLRASICAVGEQVCRPYVASFGS